MRCPLLQPVEWPAPLIERERGPGRLGDGRQREEYDVARLHQTNYAEFTQFLEQTKKPAGLNQRATGLE